MTKTESLVASAIHVIEGKPRRPVRTRRRDAKHMPGQLLSDNLSDLRSFTAGIKRDLPAAIAGLTLRWSSGRVEGRVNRVKTIKKSTDGRTALALTQRVLLPN